MNDNWIKPFQDKLGEFELDVPSTAPVRRKTVWLAPLLAGVAAAGLLLMLVALYVFFGGMKSAGVGGILKMGVLWVSLAVAGFFAFTVKSRLPWVKNVCAPASKDANADIKTKSNFLIRIFY